MFEFVLDGLNFQMSAIDVLLNLLIKHLMCTCGHLPLFLYGLLASLVFLDDLFFFRDDLDEFGDEAVLFYGLHHPSFLLL